MPRLSSELSRLVTPEGHFSHSFLRWLEGQRDSVLLETTQSDRKNFRSYLFRRPIGSIRARTLDEVESSLSQIEQAVRDGYHVAGFIAYEAGYAFESALGTPLLSDLPLVCFGIYEQPMIFNHKTMSFESGRRHATNIGSELRKAPNHVATDVLSIHPALSEDEYREAVSRIKTYIVEGDTYQVNFTFKTRCRSFKNGADLYFRLRNVQRVGYSAFMTVGTKRILSFSPELFFRREGNKLTLKPMKGTAPRGRTTEEDDQQRAALIASEKDRAENLMIVDLLRNDAGKVARFGSVRVSKFFEVERYETVFQATSTVEATLNPGIAIPELVKSLFPSGSVTGAPKIRTMQIIRELESGPRGVYTGSMGFFAPKRRAMFNVAIRTVVLDTRSGECEMGVGSGVVADSDNASEYQECLLKSKFLTADPEEFQLFETLRWEKENGWFLLPLHLRRLKESARYFGFRYDAASVRSALKRSEGRLKELSRRGRAIRVRMTLDRNGMVEFSYRALSPLSISPLIGISGHRTDSANRFFFHKTTRRKLYDTELEHAKGRGLFDLLFFNEREELTEGARTNVILRTGNSYLTPPISCGVLAGTYRAHLFRKKSFSLEEKILSRKDLLAADEVFVCNAVRGMIKVRLTAGES